MKLDEKVNEEVVTSGGIESSAFQIKTNAKAFRVLFSNIYTNKIGAIVRELSSNALDAHAEVGKRDTPFYVGLPTRMNPYFVIEDYGPGLSDEMIRGALEETTDAEGNVHQVRKGGLYTTLFESTKEDTNDAIGAFGLGSKTPFAYTNSFVVKSRHNGVENQYNAYLDEHGTPQIAHLTRNETEKTGMAIQIPVQDRDFSDFRAECHRYFKYYNVTPESNEAFSPVTKKAEGNRWFIPEEKGWGFNPRGLHVLVGQIAYNVQPTTLLEAKIADSMLLKKLSEQGYHLVTNIGEVTVDVSRENIVFDDKTIATMRLCIADVLKEDRKLIRSVVSEYETKWEALQAITQIRHKLLQAPKPNDYLGRLKNGKVVRNQIEIDLRGKSLHFSTHGDRGLTSSRHRESRVINIVGGDRFHSQYFNMTYCLQDTHRRGVGKVQKKAKEEDITIVLFKSNMSKKLSKWKAEKTRQYLSHHLGGAKVWLTSELDFPQEQREAKPTPQVLVFDPLPEYQRRTSTQVGFSTKDWKNVENFDFDKGGIYVPMKAFSPVREHDTDLAFMDFNRVVKVYRVLFNQNTPDVIGVRKGDLKKFQESDKWQSLEDITQKKLKERREELRLSMLFYDRGVSNEITIPLQYKYERGELSAFYDKAMKLDSKDPYRRICEDYIKPHYNDLDTLDFRGLYQLHSLYKHFTGEDLTPDTKKYVDSYFEVMYPVTNSRWSGSTSLVSDIVELEMDNIILRNQVKELENA